MTDFLGLALTAGALIVIGVAVVGSGVVLAVLRWGVDQIRHPWRRLIRSIGYNDSIQVVNAGRPDVALAEAWRLHARAAEYAHRPAPRFQVTVALVDGLLGGALRKANEPEDALAHLLPAITTLRGVRGVEKNLMRFLQSGAWAMAATGDYESALPLIDESLALLRLQGRARWQSPAMFHGVHQRIKFLTELRRLDEAIATGAEVITAARKAKADKASIATVLVAYSGALSAADRHSEAVDAAAVAVQSLRGSQRPRAMYEGVRALAHAYANAERWSEAVQIFDGMFKLPDEVAAQLAGPDVSAVDEDRALYAYAKEQAGIGA